MPALPARATTAGSIALALALALPSAAFADGSDRSTTGERDQGHAGTGRGAAASGGQSASASQGASASRGTDASRGNSSGQKAAAADEERTDSTSDAAEKRTSGEARATEARSTARDRGTSADAAGQGRGEKRGSATAEGSTDKGSAGKGATEKGSSADTPAEASQTGRAADGDPLGNNGTVKIDGAPLDDGRGNEPHIECADFAIDFYGFDEGDAADLLLTAHAPTKGGELWSRNDETISTTPAGGGQDVDASIEVLLADLVGLPAPHPKQGYHVKLTADVTSAPGGAKQKVFWIEPCAEEAVAGTEDTDSTSSGTGQTSDSDTDVPPTLASGDATDDVVTDTGTGAGGGTATGTPDTGSTVSGATTDAATGVTTSGTAAPTLGSGTSTVTAQEAVGTAVLSGSATSAAQGAPAASAQAAAVPSALPFTGSAALLYLLGLGLSALGVGALAHRMGRQAADLA